MDEFVTVVIPTFNRAHCVGRAINSVLSQTYTDREMIVVDDGSTDNTPEMLSSFGDAVRVIRQPNSGPSMARNTGIRAARGKYIAFLDSDDEWMPDKLERQVRLMQEDKVVLSATNWRRKDSQVAANPFDSLGFEESWICDSPPAFVSRPGGHRTVLSSWLVRRDALLALGGFNNSLTLAEDNELLLRLAFVGRFALLNKVLVLIEEKELDSVNLSRPGTLNYHRSLARAMCLATANARILSFGESKSVQRQFDKLYAYQLCREMEFAALEGRAWAARRRALEALIYNPNTLDAVAACLGLFAPSLIRWRTRKKYWPPGNL